MLRRFWLVGVGLLLMTASAGAVLYGWLETASREPLPGVRFHQPGWQLRVARRMPEDVSALLVQYDTEIGVLRVIVGTAPFGGVYWFNPQLPESTLTVAQGLGDTMQFGTCCVSDLGVHDLDRDGTPELLAETCQIQPPGRPRLYVWTMAGRPIPRAVARPDIQSSFSHGLGFVPGTTGDSVFSTFCGHGEIVQYKLVKQADAGFTLEALAWKQLGRLPASGEGTQVADADNDGDADLCFATGFQLGGAAVHVYDLSGEPNLTTPRLIDESGRFGNVKFLAGSLREGEPCDLLAWWCKDLAGGDSEFIRYRLGPPRELPPLNPPADGGRAEKAAFPPSAGGLRGGSSLASCAAEPPRANGVQQREVLARDSATQIWPIDGQMTLVDTNGDGTREAWFVTASGNVLRYDTKRNPAVTLVCHIDEPLGPIAGDNRFGIDGAALYIGCGNAVLALEPTPSHSH